MSVKADKPKGSGGKKLKTAEANYWLVVELDTFGTLVIPRRVHCLTLEAAQEYLATEAEKNSVRLTLTEHTASGTLVSVTHLLKETP